MNAPRGPRLALLLTGIGALYWLALEDPAQWPPLTLGAAFASLLALQLVSGSLRVARPGPGRVMVSAVAGGLLAGTGACLLAAGLMLFKNARHAHSVPDFGAAQVLAILQLAPSMGLSGALTGLALALVSLLWRREPSP